MIGIEIKRMKNVDRVFGCNKFYAAANAGMVTDIHVELYIECYIVLFFLIILIIVVVG